MLIAQGIKAVRFQSTLPTRGSDIAAFVSAIIMSMFQSTLPTRGSDDRKGGGLADNIRFNPRSPRGGATFNAHLTCFQHIKFQSTLPTRGSDPSVLEQMGGIYSFQSTLPTRGSDWPCLVGRCLGSSFNPRSPRGGATCPFASFDLTETFVSIHAPHEGERRYAV